MELDVDLAPEYHAKAEYIQTVGFSCRFSFFRDASDDRHMAGRWKPGFEEIVGSRLAEHYRRRQSELNTC